MSSSAGAATTIFMTDTPVMIARKVNKYAFSGGQATAEDQRQYGANLEVDVPYQYLRHIIDDDERLHQLGVDYAAGRLMTGEVKQICINELTAMVKEHQSKMAEVTDDVVRHFMDPARSSLRCFQ